MAKEDLFAKIKTLVQEGKLDHAKGFYAEHKDSLGDYAAKAKTLIHSSKDENLVDKVKHLFDQK
ncbi:hypothetical protein [Brochothrix campestris]|uniref:Uncharacterized protein n=1 Tax=Brochothrix campestris FSL F6-1037 TaxID=1265861 RepID=W7D1D8_9LIST|nr:hypothetical protein [Brochothrix campestris]EUJ41766.1 hypothetical protein BCAMP_02765 [Brochothrix campestris FSL F6-1037]